MAKREGMYFYRDWIESFELLSDAERGRMVLAMMKYAMEKEQPPQFEGVAKMAATFLFPQIDRSRLCRENGKKGAEVSNSLTKEEPGAPKEKEKREGEKEKRFEEFWREYPKKTGKAEARKAFFEIDPDDALLEKMTDAIKAQKSQRQWKSEGGRYIPAPALWLSREQWEDEPCDVSESEKKGSFDTDDFFEAAIAHSYEVMENYAQSPSS